MLELADHWTWDFWLAHEGRTVHVFFLKAPKSLGDPDLRHWNASIGHAVSDDLRHWTVLSDALGPGAEGGRDDLATWTGSVVQDGERWWMFYTGVSRADAGLRQRVLRAWSTDLTSWTKDGGFVLEADPMFEQLDPDVWPDLCWRDPLVRRDEQAGGWSMLVTARAPEGPADARGVVALLRSPDLEEWQAVGPVTTPGDWGHMEVPQVVQIRHRHYLVFCAYAACTSAARQARVGAVTGTHYYVGAGPDGPFGALSDELFAADAAGSLYAGKLVPDPVTGHWGFLAFVQFDETGEFVGALSDPLPVEVHADGSLTTTWAVPGTADPEQADRSTEAV